MQHISEQAARDGRLDIVKNKLTKRRVQNVNKKDEENMTALHYAVRFNHLEIVQFLVSKGASMSIANLPRLFFYCSKSNYNWAELILCSVF